MREFDNALHRLLTGDSALMTLATGGVWKRAAPQGAALPYVVVKPLRPFERDYTFTRAGHEAALYRVEAIVEMGSSGGATATGYDLQDRLGALCTDPASFPMANGRSLMELRALSRIDASDVLPGGDRVWRCGWLVRAMVALG